MVITGEVGMGKTILLRKLIRDLDPTVKFIFVSSSHLTSYGLLDVMARDLGIAERKTRFEVTQELRRRLLEKLSAGRTIALLVDEAQNLSDRALESLCSLSNLETDNEKLLQIVLVGQPALIKKLSRPSLRQVKQRVAIQHLLRGLQTKSELEDYIRHRLRIAHYDGPEIFNQEALETIWRLSSGTPRLVNLLCDKSLALICEAGAREISADVVVKAAAEFQLENELPIANLENSEITAGRMTTANSYAVSSAPDASAGLGPADAQPSSISMQRPGNLRGEPAAAGSVPGSISLDRRLAPYAKSQHNEPRKNNLEELIESVKRSNETQFQKRIGLKWKIAGAFSGMTLILCALLGIGVYYLTQQALRDQLEKRALAIAMNLSDASAGYILGNNLLSLNALLTKFMFRDGVAYAFVQNTEGTIVAHTFGIFPSELRRGLPIGRQRMSIRREVSLQEKPIYETSVPILDGQLGGVHVGFWEDAMTNEIQRGLLPVIGAIAMVPLLGALLSLVVAQRIVRPITRLTQVADKITRGDLQTSGEYPKSRDEIGDLARSLERMRASLKAAMSRLGHESM
jgi:MSHA biogenesis protein MshM